MLAAVGCAKEEGLEPGNLRENYFTPAPGATDPESVLRNEFFSGNGVHLLFNDTLRHEKIGVDPGGNDIYHTETVEMRYNLTSTSLYPFVYDYLPDMNSKTAAAELIEKHILPRLGESLHPYSILAVNTIGTYRLLNGEWRPFQNFIVYNGMRCTAVAVEGIAAMNEAERLQLGRTILVELLSARVSSSSDSRLTEFFDKSTPYYKKDKEYDMGWWDGYTLDDVRNLGFLYDKEGWYLPNKTDDTAAYVEAMFLYTGAEFEAEFGGFGIIMDKYDLLRRALLGMGVVLD